MLAANMFQRNVLGKTNHRLKKFEMMYHCFAWFLPVTSSIGLLLTNKYGFAESWCWISGNDDMLRFKLFYIPLWMASNNEKVSHR